MWVVVPTMILPCSSRAFMGVRVRGGSGGFLALGLLISRNRWVCIFLRNFFFFEGGLEA